MSRASVKSPIAVLGGSRGTGSLVAALAKSQGRDTRVVDVFDSAEALQSAMAGARAIIHIPARGTLSLAQQVENLLEAQCAELPRSHVVLVTGFSIGHGLAHRMNTRGFLRDRQQAEALLRRADSPYTIIRPTWLTSDPAGCYAITLSQDPLIDGMIARADLAEACLAACDERSARGKTFSLFAQPGSPDRCWGTLFARLSPDHESAR
jgi:uncharacterized protein YbjT (DUF2867 family)